jgi:Ca2+-binding EF-hand superfamily protein
VVHLAIFRDNADLDGAPACWRSSAMKTRIFIIPLAALALCGCASWFGGGHHRVAGGGPEEWHPPREMLVKYDANHDGTLTRAELEAGLRADFAEADAKHTGCLDKDEVRAVNERRWQEDRSTASPLVDFKGLGCIDFDEYAATPRSLFDQMDKNGDGQLTPDELNPHARGGQKPNGEHQRAGRHGHGGGGGEGQDGGDEGPGDPDGD